MPYLTDIRYESLLDLPISLPETKIGPNEWIVITTVKIQAPQAFTLSLLQMTLVSALNVGTGQDSLSGGPSANGVYPFPGIPALVDPNMGLTFLALYSAFDPLSPPTSQAAQEVPTILADPSNILPIYAQRTLSPATFSAPGAYSFVLCNNTSNCELRMNVLGQVRLDLGLS